MLSLYVRFKLVPSTKALFVPHLAELMKTMADEPTFVSAVLSEDADAADELVLFEVWNGSLDQWLREQPKKQYRAVYDDATKDFVADKEVRFLSPVVLQN
ncbi:quinol monooxygenase YgiN [Paraburkholderia youngii]|uniref:Antibiotic biosynthesis monooxygenase n=1 Tax=Paraburkholderia youngii TaxID=2782701 RepID=A0A7W8L359_9BURK|nr:antibiotic biosynthesis monooxygenase [Paraburkholderia youngii]MBB5399063.1 quinol monooxygenase YgiN [Paraburkholderia youngii]NUX56170.1 antibiotic biosynthesis monooxygenase [Paraburkholderia youngii]NVI08360.1 antibiotic biosynthesis monooxygenase [Paraburkholderia youngii]